MPTLIQCFVVVLTTDFLTLSDHRDGPSSIEVYTCLIIFFTSPIPCLTSCVAVDLYINVIVYDQPRSELQGTHPALPMQRNFKEIIGQYWDSFLGVFYRISSILSNQNKAISSIVLLTGSHVLPRIAPR